MATRTRPNKNASQIVFDITSGEDEFVTMNLQTIPNRQNPVKKPEDFSLRTDDIDGARYVPKKICVHDFYNVTDIEGTTSKPMVNKNKKPYNVMDISDIDGAKSRIIQQLPHSKRATNPVAPEYDWPKYQCPYEPPPKFIRDTMKNDDVEGAHPASYKTDKPPRDIMRVDDISGAKPACHIRSTKEATDRTFNVKDINNDGIFKTRRVTDPLNPVYHLNGEDLTADDFGKHIGKPEPKNIPNLYSPADIPGAHADSTSAWTRSFRSPPPPKPDDDFQPAPILMTSSMKAQTKELEIQEKIRQKRGERINAMENRNLHVVRGTGDPIQDLLRQQRENKSYHPTFS